MAVLVLERHSVGEFLFMHHRVDAVAKQQESCEAQVALLFQRLRDFQQRQLAFNVRGWSSAVVGDTVCSTTPEGELAKQRCSVEEASGEDIDVESPCVTPLRAHQVVPPPATEGDEISRVSPEAANEASCALSVLGTKLTRLSRAQDPDATESSSGGETDDELEVPARRRTTVTNRLAIRRAQLEWDSSRAQIAARWAWLQAQIADIEHRIRRQGDVYMRLRPAKKSVRLAPVPNMYHRARASSLSSSDKSACRCGKGTNGIVCTCRAKDSQPGNSPSTHAISTQTSGETTKNSVTSPVSGRGDKAAPGTKSSRSSSEIFHAARTRAVLPRPHRRIIKSSEFCRSSSSAKRSPASSMQESDSSLQHRTATVDPCFHPILSFSSDVPASLALESSASRREFETPMLRLIHRKRKLHMHSLALGNAKKTRFAKSRQLLSQARARSQRITLGGQASFLSPEKVAETTPSTPVSTSGSALFSSSAPNSSRRRGSSTDTPAAGGRRTRPQLSLTDTLPSSAVQTPIRRHSDNPPSTPSTPLSMSLPAGVFSSLRQPQSSRKRGGTSPYDINSIVVPLASTTRVEKIHYKEIETPQWREVNAVAVNGSAEDASIEVAEDISDEAYSRRHTTLEAAERARYLGMDKKKKMRGSTSIPSTPEAIVSTPSTPLPSSEGSWLSSQSLEEHVGTTPAPVQSRKTSSRNLANLSRSMSLSELENMFPFFCVPWERRTFPLSDYDMEALTAPSPLAPTASASASRSGFTSPQIPSTNGSLHTSPVMSPSPVGNWSVVQSPTFVATAETDGDSESRLGKIVLKLTKK